MIHNDPPLATVGAPVESPRTSAPLDQSLPTDRRPRALRWLLPTACSSSVPLTGVQQAKLKLIAYH